MIFFLIPLSFILIAPVLNDGTNLPRSLLVSIVPFIIYAIKPFSLKPYIIVLIPLCINLVWFLIVWVTQDNQSYADFLLGAYGRNMGFLFLTGAYFCLILSAHAARKLKNINILFQMLNITMYLGIFYGMLQFLGIDPINWTNKSLIYLTFGNTNQASAFFGVFTVLPIVQIFIGKKDKAKNVFTLSLLFFLISETDSSQGFLLLLFNLVCVILLNKLSIMRKRASKLGKKITILSSVSVMLISGFTSVQNFAVIERSLQIKARIFQWQIGIDAWLSNFWFGVGLEHLYQFSGTYVKPDYVKNYGGYTLTDHSHNLFIDFFAFGGFIAGISWIIFLFVIVKFVIGIYRSKRQVLNLVQNQILFIIFVNFVLISLISPNSLFLFLLVMAVAGVITRVNIDSRKIIQ